jgi:glucose-6-phosphate isomerase
MNLEFYNCPKPEKFDPKILPKEKPEFLTYRPDFELLKKLASQYEQYKNILTIAHGGSINPFYGFYYALKYQAKKKVYFLNTVDPDYIYELKKQLSPENTLVLSISKSGENTTQLEETMPFSEYTVVVVTGKSSPLRAVAEKMNWPIINHPSIGGRYTGLTEVNLIAGAIAGLDVESLFEGARNLQYLYEKDNIAWRAAWVFYELEKKGFADVLLLFYSHFLFPSSFGIVQLCHESFGKDGKGQSYFAHEGPEVQHHTMQRYYGGQKNIAGLFITAKNFLHPTINTYPLQTHSVQIKGHHLQDINKVPLEKALLSEAEANLEDSRIRGIPAVHLEVFDFSAKEVGEFTAFWQLFAVYSSLLRKVDPFDQPEVENSKKISFTKRLQYKGLL